LNTRVPYLLITHPLCTIIFCINEGLIRTSLLSSRASLLGKELCKAVIIFFPPELAMAHSRWPWSGLGQESACADEKNITTRHKNKTVLLPEDS
jgi:hypothetical protein